ncbi:PD-(D/E)XK nuclease family protein [Emticicia sp. 17c]|uniref:PD-(D/E)XK nuclease family protein n=1 Tax=Emticicia sp. 17c TaxID=3127704 RepID=UPI00301DE941
MTEYDTTFRNLIENPLLKEINTLPEPNILTIGKGVKELTISNLYAYFLNPHESHGLKSLFLDSLRELLDLKTDFDLNTISIKREVHHKKKYIDIIVRDASNLILIENKLFADIYNNLEIYESYDNEKTGKYLIISVVKYYESIGEWQVSTHQQLFQIIEKRFELLAPKINIRQSENYKTFIEILKQQYDIVENLTEKLTFLSDNNEQIINLFRLVNEVKSSYLQQVSSIIRSTLGKQIKVTIERKASMNFKIQGTPLYGYVFFNDENTNKLLINIWIAGSEYWYEEWHKATNGIFSELVNEYNGRLKVAKEKNNSKDWTSIFYKEYEINKPDFEINFIQSIKEIWQPLITALQKLNHTKNSN